MSVKTTLAHAAIEDLRSALQKVMKLSDIEERYAFDIMFVMDKLEEYINEQR